jgi:hypothetical protein
VKITLIPSAVSTGDGARGFYLSSYVIDDAVAIDAGALGCLGDLSAQSRIQHVFYSFRTPTSITSRHCRYSWIMSSARPIIA